MKIELSAKAEGSSEQTKSIGSFVSEEFPDVFEQATFEVKITDPKRTFWKKAFIIHEENTAPATRNQKARLARHFYDLFQLIEKEAAPATDDLFDAVRKHRRVHFAQTWVNYSEITITDLVISPPNDSMARIWKTDYQLMKPMIYGSYSGFEEVES